MDHHAGSFISTPALRSSTMSIFPGTPVEPVVLDRREGPCGEVVLRRRGEHLEIIANGCFLMDTSDGRSERLLVRAALDALPPDLPEPRLLIGGLGVGFSLDEAAAQPRWGRITVVEREGAVIDWHRAPGAPLAPFHGHALEQPRVGIVHADLVEHLRSTPERYDALCLDIDNGPDWTVTDGNGGLYSGSGLASIRRVLRDGGVLAVWSAAPSPGFEERLRAHFVTVRRFDVELTRRSPDVVYLASQTT
jgi:spermidine synthase